MLQRIVYRVIQQGVQFFTKNPSYITQLFTGNEVLDADEAKAVTALWLAKQPNVTFGYAAQDSTFPQICVVMAAENEETKFVGDSAGDVELLGDPDFGAEQFSSLWAHAITVFVQAEHPDACWYYYEIVKSMLAMAHNYFVNVGAMNMAFSGEELLPDERFNPAIVFTRRLVVRGTREFKQVDPNSKGGKAWRVDGIFVDRSGSSSDPGNVKTNVNPEPDEGEDG